MANSPYFWNWIANRYAKRPVDDPENYQKKLARSQEIFTQDMELLEVGCGTGTTALIHAPFVKHIQAVDFAAEMIAIAKQKAADQNIHNVSFEQAGLNDMSIPPDSKDAVLALSILHLLPDLDEGIKTLSKVIKPSGYFISSTVCLGKPNMLLSLFLTLGSALGLLPYVNFLSQKYLEAKVEAAGFKLVTSWQAQSDKAVFIIAQKSPVKSD